MTLLEIIVGKEIELNEEPAHQSSLDRLGLMPDEELAEVAKTNETALSMLYRRHVDRISRYVARRITTECEAEDVTSQVFLAMVKGLPNYQTRDVPFIAWLYRLATNAIISWTRRQKFRKWIGFSTEPAARAIPPQDDAEELHFALQQVEEPFQRTLVLHYIEQLPVSTVAQVLGVAEGTVKTRLMRGRCMLRDILESRRD